MNYDKSNVPREKDKERERERESDTEKVVNRNNFRGCIGFMYLRKTKILSKVFIKFYEK